MFQMSLMSLPSGKISKNEAGFHIEWSIWVPRSAGRDPLGSEKVDVKEEPFEFED